jgi:WD40 repeat protein
MLPQDDIKNLLKNHTHRLQQLKEECAHKGGDAEPELLLEIKHIEHKIQELQTDLDKAAATEGTIELPTIVLSSKGFGQVSKKQSSPIIHRAQKISLTAEEKALLQRMFGGYSRLALEAEYGRGLSGGRVFRVRPVGAQGQAHLSVVVKIGPADLINQEWQAYRAWVENTLPGIARVKSAPVPSLGRTLSALRYELVGGGIFEVQSLADYYHQASVEDLVWVLKERLFPVMSRSWWLDNWVEPVFHLRTNYDSLLPVNLVMTMSDALSDEALCQIEPGKPPSLPVTAGISVQLKGFVVVEIDPAKAQLTLNAPQTPDRPAQAAYRLRLEQVPQIERFRVGQRLDSVYGVVIRTRQDILMDQARQAVGEEIDLTQERLTLLDLKRLSNPLFAYEKILDRFLEAKISTIHGDLNLENILVDPGTRDINLIDFATVRQGYALHDLLRLETEIVTKLIPVALTGAKLPPETIYSFYQQLGQATFQPGAPPLRPSLTHPNLAKPLAMLTTIRAEARKCLFDADDPTEYYQGLTLYLLGALKFKNLDEIPQAKAVAFWGAAAIISSLFPVEEMVEPVIPPCPYRGLEAFDVEHADLFFGREKLTDELLARLQPTSGQAGRFLAIVGPSGSGKSSLARAGVVAALRRGAIEGSTDWPVVICRPGIDPLKNLAVAFSNIPGLGQGLSEVRKMIQDFRDDPGALDLATCLALRGSPPGRRLVLLVDQFEEIFSLCHDETSRQAFLDNLIQAATTPEGQTIVLLTMRADFYGKCAAYPALAKILSNHQELVGPMTADELRQAIEQPAHQAGCYFEVGLVPLLLYEIQDQSGSLPLLQYALTELWTRQEKQRLTRPAYEAIGGVTGALERRGEAIYHGFNSEQQEICRRIFLRLTQLGEGTEDTKRQVSLSELLPAGGELAAVEAVIQALASAEARLITTKAEGESESQQVIEVAHEALIRSWPRLQDWLDEDREAVRTQRRLTEVAREWVQHNLDESYLYRGARLVEAEQWAQSHSGDLSALEQTFLQTSLDEREREMAEQEAFRQREIEQTQALAKAMFERAQEQSRATYRLRRLAVVLAVVFLIAIGAALLAWNREQIAQVRQQEAEHARQTAEARRGEADLAQTEANKQARIATSRALAAAAITSLATDPELSLLLALQAISTTRTSEAEQALHQAVQTSRVRRTLVGHTGRVFSIAFSPDGSRLATAGEDQTIKIWDVMSGQALLTLAGHTKAVDDVVFSPDGTHLASASRDDTARLWEVTTGRELLTLRGHQDRVSQVVFSPDGTRLATASHDQTIKLWDVSSGRELMTLSGHAKEVKDVAFNPDGTRLASASEDQTAKIWDVVSGTELLSLSGHTGIVWAIAFSPDGTRLATASQDETAKIWDAASGQLVLTLSGQNNVVWDVTFSPDGRRLATANTEGTARLWSAATGQPLLTLAGHTLLVKKVLFSPDGMWLATASEDGTARIWDVTGHSDIVNDVVFSPDGTQLATASQDGTAKLWRLVRDSAESAPMTEAQELLTLSGHTDSVKRIAFSPHGTWLATTSGDGTARIWDTASGRLLLILSGHTGPVQGVTITPEGDRLATSSLDQTIKIWQVSFNPARDSASAQELFTLRGHEDWVNEIAFSPDGNRLVSVGADETARVWDAHSGQELFIWETPDDLGSVTFSPDGTRLAGAGVDGTARVWVVELGQLALTLTGHTNFVRDITFSPTGDRLATASYDKTARVWSAASGETLFILGYNAEFNSVAFSPDGTRLATANTDGSFHLYLLDDFDQLIVLARERATRTLTPAECQRYLQQTVCPTLP